MGKSITTKTNNFNYVDLILIANDPFLIVMVSVSISFAYSIFQNDEIMTRYSHEIPLLIEIT